MSSDAKKQVPLRLSQGLYAELVRLAESEFRSVNGQIEYILTQAVRQRRGDDEGGPDYDHVPPEEHHRRRAVLEEMARHNQESGMLDLVRMDDDPDL